MHRFPGTVDGISYDYNELLATLWLHERYSATVAFSNDVFGSGGAGFMYELGADYELPADVSLALGYGRYDLHDAYGARYSYLDVAVSRPLADVTVTLAYHDTFGDVDRLFDARVTGARYVLALDIGF